MSRTRELQERLLALGFNPGVIDGVYGPDTENACLDAVEELEGKPDRPGVIPADWLPKCEMDRIICHWTAGAYTASAEDRSHYHILIEGDGKLIRGTHSILDNVSTADGNYAAHTKNCNTKSIGVSMCCMAGAVENPFNPGDYPMTVAQFDKLVEVVLQLCQTYFIACTPQTVLSHAEVQGTLGIAQAGKWDFTRLAFKPSRVGAKSCGDYLRERVNA